MLTSSMFIVFYFQLDSTGFIVRWHEKHPQNVERDTLKQSIQLIISGTLSAIL